MCVLSTTVITKVVHLLPMPPNFFLLKMTKIDNNSFWLGFYTAIRVPLASQATVWWLHIEGIFWHGKNTLSQSLKCVRKAFLSTRHVCSERILTIGKKMSAWESVQLTAQAHLFRGGWGKANKQKSLVAFRNQDHRWCFLRDWVVVEKHWNFKHFLSLMMSSSW